jgi:hypothetical protein
MLIIHSWLRWIICFFLIVTILRSLNGVLKKKNFNKADSFFSGILVGFTHLQLILGFSLYLFLSPFVSLELADFKTTVSNVIMRFWTLEHPIMMILFVILVQTSRIIVKKTKEPLKKHKKNLTFMIICVFILIAGTPWPFTKIQRPLFRSSLEKTNISIETTNILERLS